ncbi:MAG TPA: CSLREA domain-containing protein [Actinomycetota bacterium]|nr:CSLREA domain-containing protein [Actinomycetota bacterium]
MQRLVRLPWLVVMLLALLPAPAGAGTLTVTRTDDPPPDGCSAGDCSLREAVLAANTSVGPDAVLVPAGRYVLSIPPDGTPDDGLDGDLDITEDLILEGAGAPTTILDANHVDRVVQVICCETDVFITGVTITNGTTANPFGGGGVMGLSVQVTLSKVSVVGNVTTNANGGGVSVSNPDARLNILDSTITGNVASEPGGANGGGISNGNQATAVLSNVTVSANRASQVGGGIDASGPITLTNVTITGNAVMPDAGYMGSSRGGGIFFGGASAQMTDTIMAGNTAATEDPDCYSITQVTSGGHNLVQTHNSPNCGFTTVEGDLTGVDPLLGPLTDNGGPTMTHALLSGSPAIDAGGPGCAGNDQRGLARVDCDIGAYELVFCRGIPVNRVGTLEGDSLVGTPGKDGLLGLGGRDRLRGKGGADGLCGGPSKDLLKGGGGKDRFDGGPGRDTCLGQAGRDKAKGCELKKSIP